jgi:hypothetical protein
MKAVQLLLVAQPRGCCKGTGAVSSDQIRCSRAAPQSGLIDLVYLGRELRT